MGLISNYMLRVAENPAHGYDQRHRDGDPDFDCSSLVIAAVRAAGYDLRASYTGDLYAGLIRCGFRDVTRYIDLDTGAGLQIDDILLYPGRHTAVYTGSGCMTDARISETGTKYAKLPGDQTGHEIETHPYKNHPWEYVLRKPSGNSFQFDHGEPVENDVEMCISSLSDYDLALNVLQGKYGDGEERKAILGDRYAAVQKLVNEMIYSGY